MGENKYSFQKLTPVSNANIAVYEEAIDFVFNNLDVKNVAVSGAYSAGKSSILESYKATHKNLHFVHLSLAHFRTPEQENQESGEVVKESVLEGKILNQLIHQIPAERIPQTNFRVKKGVSPKSLALLTIFTSLFFASIVFLSFAQKITAFIGALPDNWVKIAISPLSNPYAPIPFVLVSAACSVAFIFSLIRAQKNKNVLRKISLQGNEIEIFEEQEDSYFDKYLNEVLYLFENVDADVIVFEDMDRFNASRIFERLREVNTLVNIQRKKDMDVKYYPLRFFYLLRDDIFISKDRTKFFDYIIPIVPVVDSSNSYNQFLKHLKAGGFLDKFELSFLQGLSLYVDDMRILKNIYNEFVIYFNRLNTTELDSNKMMAIISYKNLFPRDFCDLQLARGFVFELFSQKDKLIDRMTSTLQEKLSARIERIKRAKDEHLVMQQELDDAYAAKIDRLPKNSYTQRLESIEIKKQYESELLVRKKAIQDKLGGNILELESELPNIENQIFWMERKSGDRLKDIITRENIDYIFAITHSNEIGEIDDFCAVKRSDYFDLLKFLIRNGYLDENYADYMTYFYEDSISANDKAFLRRIADKRGAEYTYALRDPKIVVESPILITDGFEQEEALNFDLFEYLLRNEDKFPSYLNRLMYQIRKSENFDFVSKYYDTGKTRKLFVQKVNEQWPRFFSRALQEKTLTSAQIRQFSIETLCYSNEDSIASVNVDECLSAYISNSPDYLTIIQPDIERLILGFSVIKVSFVTIDYETSDKSLFDGVYQNCFYELNFENIALMLRKEYDAESDIDIFHRNYTTVERKSKSPLSAYVAENINTYTNIILDNCNGNIADDENIAISLLNNSEVDSAAKRRYVNLLSTVIGQISRIEDLTLWAAMLNRRVVAFSTANYINYFTKHEIDAALIEFINDEQSEFDFSTAAIDFGEETAKRLFDAVIVCDSINTSKYRKILIELGYYFNNYDTAEISDEKIDVLISEKIVRMDMEGLIFVREKFQKHIFTFIRRNLDEYLAMQTAEIFVLDEALQILTWDIEEKRKTELLVLTDEPISIIGKRYSDAVNALLITHNHKSGDEPFLYANYSQYGDRAKTAISVFAIAGVEDIITNNMDIDDSLLSVLLQADDVARNQKIILFTMSIPSLDEETCSHHLDELDLPNLKNIFTKGGSRRKYDKSDEVTTILEALKMHRWIYDYTIDEQNSEKYFITRNRPKSKEPVFLD